MSSLSQINDILIHISIFFNTKTIQNMTSLKLLLQTNKEINKIVLEESNYILFKHEIIFDNDNMHKYIDIYIKYHKIKNRIILIDNYPEFTKIINKKHQQIYFQYKDKIEKQLPFISNKMLDVYYKKISTLIYM
jgi:hypothetical protein